MTKLFGKTLAVMLAATGSGILWENVAIAQQMPSDREPTASPAPTTAQLPPADTVSEPALGNPLAPAPSKKRSGMAQVTSVSQLSDVQPTDWAFGALQSLVERYGCIEGYPDRTYRGNRAITRYEFAAGLNECLNRIRELIETTRPTTPSGGVSREDLDTLQRLQQDFAAELANLRSRVDTLQARTTTLEAQQFSATTKLRGTVLTYLGDAFGENADPLNNPALQYRAILNFTSSFTGKDQLIVGLQSFNFRRFNPGAEFPTGRLSNLGGVAGATDETRFAPVGLAGNGELRLFALQYAFPVTDTLRVNINAFSRERAVSERVTPFTNTTLGPVSYYGRINPMIYPVGSQTGVDLLWRPRPWLDFAFSAASELGSAENPDLGLFNGGYLTSARSTIAVGDLRLIAGYVHTYSPRNGIDTLSGSNASKVTGVGPVVANTYFGGLFYEFSPRFELGGSVAYSDARALGEGTKGDASVFDYRVNAIFYDLGKKGNLGGLIFGTQPRLTGTSTEGLARRLGLPVGQRSDRDVGFHIEAFYTHRVNNNITITPGVFWLTAPNHDDRNPDVIVGVIRTSFTF